MLMSIENVKIYLKNYKKDGEVRELAVSSATVELAAKALNTEPARIAKTLSFKAVDRVILVVAAGDVKLIIKSLNLFSVLKQKCSIMRRLSL